MKAPVSQLDDPDMQAAPQALLRAAEKARRLAEQTGTPFVVRQPDLRGEKNEQRETVNAAPVPARRP